MLIQKQSTCAPDTETPARVSLHVLEAPGIHGKRGAGSRAHRLARMPPLRKRTVSRRDRSCTDALDAWPNVQRARRRGVAQYPTLEHRYTRVQGMVTVETHRSVDKWPQTVVLN